MFRSPLLALISLVFVTVAQAESTAPRSNVVADATEACRAEMSRYCSNVTPGNGRVLACMYAHQDKLSPQCEIALIDAAHKLEKAMESLTEFAEACMADVDKHCAQVPTGQGRVLSCLESNRAQLDPACAKAIDESGLMQ